MSISSSTHILRVARVIRPSKNLMELFSNAEFDINSSWPVVADMCHEIHLRLRQ